MRLQVLAMAALGVAPCAMAASTTFVNDHAGFVAAADALTLIDFETLPNGSPSLAGTPINAGFNYGSQGAVFSALTNDLVIAGNSTSGFSIRAGGITFDPTNIRADLVSPASAVGIFFPGGTTLSAFDTSGTLIDSVSHFSSGSGLFLGIVSDVPIGHVIVDRSSFLEDIESFEFAPASCPGTLTFVNDQVGFAIAANALTVIDFETLPDGIPSVAGTPINAAFNYGAQGAFFSSPGDDLIIAGNPIVGFSVQAGGFGFDPTHIRADLVLPASAVGIFFPGGTTLTAFDTCGAEICSISFSGGGSGFFLGIVSDVPIGHVIVDRGSSSEDIQSFEFATIPFCIGDADGNKVVNFADITAVLGAWLSSCP